MIQPTAQSKKTIPVCEDTIKGKHSSTWLLVAFFTLLCWLAPLSLFAAIQVSAQLSHNSFPINKGALLTVTITGSKSADITVPEVEQLRFHNRGKSSQFNMINGKVSSSVSYNYVVEALQPGEYTLPPIQVVVDSQQFTTQPITFTATSGGQKVRPGQTEQGKETTEIPAFIKVSRLSSHYPGEIVPVEVKAYFSQKYRIDINSLPVLHGDGVVMDQLSDKPVRSEESVKGEIYNVLRWDTTVSGIKEGTHKIFLSLDATLLIPQKRRSRPSMSPFGSSLFDDSFFDSVFGGYTQRPITSVSPELDFTIQPLPKENQPANFTGAIGNFSMQAKTNSQVIDLGEPITLTVSISGEGNFDRVDSPDFPNSAQWKSYTPTANFEELSGNYSGVKSFERAIVARDTTVTEIPALSFSYFDPKKKEYITLNSSPIPLTIQGPQVVQTPTPIQPPRSGVSRQAPTTTQPSAASYPGLAPVKLVSGDFSSTIQPIFKQVWFLAISAFCLLVLITLLILKIRSTHRYKNPQISENKNRRIQLSKNLKMVEEAQQSGSSKNFLARCRQTIQELLGELWQIEPTAISLQDLIERLEQDSALIKIFKTAEDSVYGGATLSSEQMSEFFTQLNNELEKMI